MNFAKMEGCANDFIITQDIAEGRIAALTALAPRLCDRRRGIGADGIVLVLPSEQCDYKMRIINADGSEAEMCGNGIRCFAVYLRRIGLTTKPKLSIETKAGLIQTEFMGDQVRVDMGPPILDGRKIPVDKDGSPIIGERIAAGDRTFALTAVSMGNPHAVIFADELTDELVLHYGKILESHPFFPKRTNVEFIKVVSESETRMRVYERGCGETMACGTGACASVVAGILNKKHGNKVTVHLLGGDLRIAWDGAPGQSVFMTGPANHVFDASVEIG